MAVPTTQERLSHSVLDALDEGVIVVDPRGRLVDANIAACTLLQLDLATAQADPSWWEAFRERDAVAWDQPRHLRWGDEHGPGDP